LEEKEKELNRKGFKPVGVFVDKNKELILVSPENPKIKIFSENQIQAEISIYLDKKGELIKDYFEILHIPNISEDFRLGVFGYAAISPFFHAIRKDLDIFPNLFVFGVNNSGKSTLLELLINNLYGTKLKFAYEIERVPRLASYLGSPFALNIDDIDGLNDEIMNFIKTTSCSRKTITLRKDNIIREQIYSSYTGSANNLHFIIGARNNAFRQRCMLFELKRSIKKDHNYTKFQEIKLNIKENKIVGFYLLEKALEFIGKSYTKSNLTTYEKLTRLIKETKTKLEKFLYEFNYISRKSRRIELDNRRLSIYALIYTGWQFWNYCFECNKLESPLLKKALDFETKYFLRFIKDLEKTAALEFKDEEEK